MKKSVTEILHLHWKTGQSGIQYYLNNVLMGKDKTGIDHVIKELEITNFRKLVIQIPFVNIKTGLSLEQSLPFFKEWEHIVQLSKDQQWNIEFSPEGQTGSTHG